MSKDIRLLDRSLFGSPSSRYTRSRVGRRQKRIWRLPVPDKFHKEVARLKQVSRCPHGHVYCICRELYTEGR